jgi:acetolactate decarboxylase
MTWHRSCSEASLSMPRITTDIPASLNVALQDELTRLQTDESSIVTAALAQYLKTPVHTLFQVSTSGALVSGVYSGAVSVASILEHGDLGCGTFANLDGEMVILDRRAYQVRGSGRVTEAPADARTPFAVVTQFSPDRDAIIRSVSSFSDLQKACDALRNSSNVFYAFRLDGGFRRVRTSALNPPAPGRRLLDAAKSQSEFQFKNITGTLVGLWSPALPVRSVFRAIIFIFCRTIEKRVDGCWSWSQTPCDSEWNR